MKKPPTAIDTTKKRPMIHQPGPIERLGLPTHKSTPKSQAMAKLEPKTEVMEVPVEIPDPVVSEDQAISALERQGHVDLDAGTISDLRDIGVFSKATGLLKIQRGRGMVNQMTLHKAMIAMQDEMGKVLHSRLKDKTAKMTALARTIGYLSSKLTESQRMMVGIEKLSQPAGTIESEMPMNNGFRPGQTVKPAKGSTMIMARNVHIHGNQQAEPEKEQS